MGFDFSSLIGMVIAQYGIYAVFLCSFIEEIIAPIPSSLVLLAAGFFLLPSGHSLMQILPDAIVRVTLPATVGLTLGALCMYAIAYLGGKTMILRFGKWFGISWERVEKEEARMVSHNKGGYLLFLLRAFPIVPSVLISLVAGIIRFPKRAFLISAFLGNMVRAFCMSILGWWAGEAYNAYAEAFAQLGDYMAWSIGGLIIFIIGAILVKKLIKRDKKSAR